MTIGDRRDPTYSDPSVRAWNRKVAEGEAFGIVTAEPNHSVAGELNDALDNVFVSQAFRQPTNVATDAALDVLEDDVAW